MLKDKNELNGQTLKSVVGGNGGDIDQGPDPSSYIYKCELQYIGAVCKQEPDDNSATICSINQYTIIYVTQLACGNGYVKCMFAGNSQREYGYIKEYYVPRPEQ